MRQMNGHASFNEVFLTDARVPDADIIGAPGEGWRVALTTLAHERRLDRRPARIPLEPGAGRAMVEAQAETDELMAPYVWYPQRAGRAELAARTRGDARPRPRPRRQAGARPPRIDRPHRRVDEPAGAGGARARPAARRRRLARQAAREPDRQGVGRRPCPRRRRPRDAHGPTSLLDGVIAEVLVSVPAVSIAGGTDEIQRNIIGERILGLPKEPQIDRDVPYRDVRRNPPRPPTSLDTSWHGSARTLVDDHARPRRRHEHVVRLLRHARRLGDRDPHRPAPVGGAQRDHTIRRRVARRVLTVGADAPDLAAGAPLPRGPAPRTRRHRAGVRRRAARRATQTRSPPPSTIGRCSPTFPMRSARSSNTPS